MLPLDTSLASAPQNSIIGGATLWALQGHEAMSTKTIKVSDLPIFVGCASLVAQETGYVPITSAAGDLSESQGFYKENPGLILQLNS